MASLFAVHSAAGEYSESPQKQPLPAQLTISVNIVPEWLVVEAGQLLTDCATSEPMIIIVSPFGEAISPRASFRF